MPKAEFKIAEDTEEALAEAVKIFKTWVESTIWKPKDIVQRVLKEEIKISSVYSWVESERISAPTLEKLGNRVVTLVKWLMSEHQLRPFMKSGELRRFIELYQYLPAKNILQLRRLLNDLELAEAETVPNLFAAHHWKQQFSQWTLFSHVFDELWCIRASSRYGRILSHASDDDANNWFWWHRMSYNLGHTTKFSPNSPQTALRGPYADDYYRYQMVRFRQRVEAFKVNNPSNVERADILIDLLSSTKGFKKRWEKSEDDVYNLQQIGSIQIPVPFYRQDGTLTWLVEVSAAIPNTKGYSLYTWLETDAVASEYLASIRRDVDKLSNGGERVLFIEQFAAKFTEEERFALGVESIEI